MDIHQNKKNNPINGPKSHDKQHKLIYNLMSSVKESENFANSVNSKLYDQKESPKANKKPKNLNETLSPVNSSPNGPLKSSLKMQSSTRAQFEKDLTLSNIFKNDDMAQIKFVDVKESVLLKPNNFQEPQSSLSSHMNSAQRSSLKSVRRLIFLLKIYKKVLSKEKNEDKSPESNVFFSISSYLYKNY